MLRDQLTLRRKVKRTQLLLFRKLGQLGRRVTMATREEVGGDTMNSEMNPSLWSVGCGVKMRDSCCGP